MIFDIDADMVHATISDALEAAAADVSEAQFFEICDKINTAMPGVIQVLTAGMAEHWRAEATGAGGWGSKYAAAIKTKISGNEGEVYLDEEMIDKGSKKPNMMFAMMMEKGVRSWSIKEALLRSEKAKVSKNGVKYIVIPFPVRTPRTNKNMKMNTKFGKREMTAEMYKIVKGGGRLPAGAMLGSTDVGGLTKWTSRQRHEGYGFFRCVSARSDGWQYPDIPAEPVFPKVLLEVNRRIQEVLSAFCAAIVKEYSS